MKTIKVFAPATIANINVGFDVLGMSLNDIGDRVELTFNGSEENRIIEITNGDNLPTDVSKNCCSVVIRKIQESLNDFKGVDITLHKGFASGSGLGSSSASSAAAAFGYNELMGSPYSNKELIAFAAEGERVACGSAHVDNVAPAILGGLILAQGKHESDFLTLPLLDNLYAVTLFPNIKINTSDSRKILKEIVSIGILSKQVALMGAFVSSLYEKDLNLFSNSLQDLVIEPMRSLLIPKFHELKQEAYKMNALAFGISGSGPSVFALTEGEENAKNILNGLAKVYVNTGIETQGYISALRNDSGARILN